MRATLLQGSDETSALRRAVLTVVFDAADIPLDVVSTLDELFAAGMRSRHASDYLSLSWTAR